VQPERYVYKTTLGQDAISGTYFYRGHEVRIA
jgi:hypothetical protein